MVKASNASIAVLINDSVMMAVFIERLLPDEVTPVLLKNYSSQEQAMELIVVGDFQMLAPKLEDCGHFMKAGDNLGDCMPEVFQTFKEYEDTLKVCGYGYDYLFKDGAWHRVIACKKELVYKKLKRKKYGSKKENGAKKESGPQKEKR